MGKRGPMPGTGGRPRKALSEKLADGNPGYKPIKVIPAPSTYEGVDIPKPNDYIKAKQKNGKHYMPRKSITIPGDGLLNASVTTYSYLQLWRNMR